MIRLAKTALSLIFASTAAADAFSAPFDFGCFVKASQGAGAGCTQVVRSDTEVVFAASSIGMFGLSTAAEVSFVGYLRNQVGDIGASLQMSGYAYDQFGANGFATAGTSWGDRVQIKSNTLADGTPVRVDVVKSLQVEISSAATGSLTARLRSNPRLTSTVDAYAYNGTYGAMDSVSQIYNFSNDMSETTFTQHNFLTTYVGAVVILGDSMQTSLSWEFDKPAENSLLAASFAAGISAGHSSHVFLSADQDVSFVADSGHSYVLPEISTDVPEPSTLALLGLGFFASWLSQWAQGKRVCRSVVHAHNSRPRPYQKSCQWRHELGVEGAGVRHMPGTPKKSAQGFGPSCHCEKEVI